MYAQWSCNRRVFVGSVLSGMAVAGHRAQSSESAARKLIRPPALRRGDTIALISPGKAIGFAHKPETLDVAVAALERDGYRVKVMPHAREMTAGKQAGNIQQRMEGVNTALRDPDVRVVMGTVGGGGTLDVVRNDMLDWDALQHDPKIICGYSDLACLNVAAYLRFGLITIDGPLAVFHWGCQPEPPRYGTESIQRIVGNAAPAGKLKPPATFSRNPFEFFGEEDMARRLHPTTPWRWFNRGTAQGRLLALTPVQLLEFADAGIHVPLDGHIWCLDVWTGSDRVCNALQGVIDRGMLKGVRGMVVGRPASFNQETRPSTERWDSILAAAVADTDIPVLIDVDSGHTMPRMTIPNGVMATLDSTNDLFSIDEPAVS